MQDINMATEPLTEPLTESEIMRRIFCSVTKDEEAWRRTKQELPRMTEMEFLRNYGDWPWNPTCQPGVLNRWSDNDLDLFKELWFLVGNNMKRIAKIFWALGRSKNRSNKACKTLVDKFGDVLGLPAAGVKHGNGDNWTTREKHFLLEARQRGLSFEEIHRIAPVHIPGWAHPERTLRFQWHNL